MSQADDTTAEEPKADAVGTTIGTEQSGTSEASAPTLEAPDPELAAPAESPESSPGGSALGAPPPSARRSLPRRVLQWFTRTDELNAVAATLSHEGVAKTFKRRAAAALEVAERILRPIEPMRDKADLMALEALSQSIFWAVAGRIGSAPGSRQDAWSAIQGSELAPLSHPDLVSRAFIANDSARGDLSAEELTTCVTELQSLASALVSSVHEPDTRLKALRAERGLRCGVVAVLITIAGGYGVFLVSRGANLANIASWRTSSTLNDCTPETHKCQGKAFTPFFHTNDEKSPWLEYDLGARRRVSKVVVVNRRDCCKERAVPLLVEVSDDRKHWKKVAERKKSFDKATLSFAPTSARYLRLRVNKKTAFHLESVKIYR